MRTISPRFAFTEWRTRMSASRCTRRSEAMGLPFRRGSLPALDRLDGLHLAAGLLDLPPGALERRGFRRLQVEGVAGVREGRRLDPELALLLHVEVEYLVPLPPVDAVGADEDGPESGFDHLVDVGAPQVPGDPFLDLLQPPAFQHPDPLQDGQHGKRPRLAAGVRDPVHLPGDLLDPVLPGEHDREADVVEVVVHAGKGKQPPLLELVHLAVDDPPEYLLVVLGQFLDRLVLHSVSLPVPPVFPAAGVPRQRGARTGAPRVYARSFRSAARLRTSISNSSSPSLGVSRIIGREENPSCVRIRRKPGRPILPSPMCWCRSTRLPIAVFESFRCHIRTRGRTPFSSISARAP